MALPPSQWSVVSRLPPERFRRLPDLPPLVVQLLDNRGVVEEADVRSFLAGADGQTWDPLALRGMAAAVERVVRAVEARELVAVFGDFDADGLTATALLVETLQALGARALPHIPQRDDGYGLNLPAIRQLASRGVGLVVTADCGVGSPQEVAAARELGVDVVITDHHRVNGALPAAVAVVNPRQPDCPYPFKHLAGVGVAYKLAQSLLARLPVLDGRSPAEVDDSLLDLVALGTVADVVPLLGENRVLACRGLAALNRTARPGLGELIRSASLTPGRITAWHIGYVLGPRLNAAGRLGDAGASFRLLTGGAGEARALAWTLEDANRERQQLTEEMLARARQEVLAQLPEARLLLAAGPDYAPGIVGLVASRLVEEFHRPACVVGIDGAEARGSARSIAEFDVAAALAECRDLLVRFGGHPRAAGFTVARDNLDALRARLQALAQTGLAHCELGPRLAVDAELKLRGVTWQLHQEVQRVGPFGYENPAPLFLSRGLRVLEARVVGQHAPGHLKLVVSDGSKRWPAIGFGFGDAAGSLPEVVDLVYHLEADTWRNGQSLQLNVRGLRSAL